MLFDRALNTHFVANNIDPRATNFRDEEEKGKGVEKFGVLLSFPKLTLYLEETSALASSDLFPLPMLPTATPFYASRHSDKVNRVLYESTFRTIPSHTCYTYPAEFLFFSISQPK